jgi:hypothetical protein
MFLSHFSTLRYIGHIKNTLAARGLEEPRDSQELLIESVGPVFLFCVLCEI